MSACGREASYEARFALLARCYTHWSIIVGSLVGMACQLEAPPLTIAEYRDLVRQVIESAPPAATLYVEVASFNLSEADLESMLTNTVVVVPAGTISSCLEDPPAPECPLREGVTDRILALRRVIRGGSSIEFELLMVASYWPQEGHCVGDMTSSFEWSEDGWIEVGGSYVVC